MYLGSLDPENEGNTIIRKIGNFSTKNIASHSRKLKISATPLSDLKMWQWKVLTEKWGSISQKSILTHYFVFTVPIDQILNTVIPKAILNSASLYGNAVLSYSHRSTVRRIMGSIWAPESPRIHNQVFRKFYKSESCEVRNVEPRVCNVGKKKNVKWQRYFWFSNLYLCLMSQLSFMTLTQSGCQLWSPCCIECGKFLVFFVKKTVLFFTPNVWLTVLLFSSNRFYSQFFQFKIRCPSN
jgi:hypothetical protein